MKCHYIYTEEGEKVLIPYCWPVVISGDMQDCICRCEQTFPQFEREEYNNTVKALRQEIRELESENAYLNRIIRKLTKKETMKACDTRLDLEEVCARVRPSLAAKIRYSVDLIRKSEKMALRLDPVDGFWNTFSGGKDSQCLYHLVKMAGVRHKTHMNLTSVDPPEVIRFVKTQYPDVELVKPRMSIYSMAKEKKMLPTRVMRWCCAEFKEMSGAGKVTLIGIRKEESSRRAKRQEISTDIKGKRAEETFDQWSEHEEKMVTCVGGNDKILVSPIIHWTERDVWEFLNNNHIPHCELYDKGYSRIGCICCPMSQPRQKRKEIERWPHVKRGWLKAIQWLIDNGYVNHNFADAETGFRWWISGKSFGKFYADEFLQQKFEFNEKERSEQ